MKKMYSYFVISCLLVFFSCQESEPNFEGRISGFENSLKTEKRISDDSLIESIFGKEFDFEEIYNPFLAQCEEKPMLKCDVKRDVTSIFNCVVNQFNKVDFPIKVGPIPDPNPLCQKALDDSIFISTCMNDAYFYTEPPMDRVYGYNKGKLIAKNDKYTLCLILFEFNVGFDYRLYSFKNNGEYIASITLGSKTSDVSETYGIMKNKESFEVYTNEFDYVDGREVIKNKTHTTYKVLKDGKIVKQ